MRCSYYPQSLVQVSGAIREIEDSIWGSWPAGAVHPKLPRLHRSDRCTWPVWPVQPLVGFCSGECLGDFVVVLCWVCFEFGSVWRSVGLFGVWGLSGLDRSDRCVALAWPVWSHLVEVINSHQQGPVWPVVLTGLTGVGQWTRGLVFHYVLGSEACVLVPRSSGTLVATWAWPTWVVSRRCVLEACSSCWSFHLLREEFYRLLFTPPPLWFAVSVLQWQG
jgi:hypothetical protein